MQKHSHAVEPGTNIMRAGGTGRSQLPSGTNAAYVNQKTLDAGTGDSGNLQPYATSNLLIKY